MSQARGVQFTVLQLLIQKEIGGLDNVKQCFRRATERRRNGCSANIFMQNMGEYCRFLISHSYAYMNGSGII